MDAVIFDNRQYPMRQVEIENVGLRFIASTDLNKQLVTAEGSYTSEEAKTVDEHIYFFVEPDILNLNDLELSRYVNLHCEQTSTIQNGSTLQGSIERALTELSTYNRYENTEKAILQALLYSENESPTFENVERLGGGQVGEEALAISLFCALKHATEFEKGVLLAVNHSGDTDSIGSITGTAPVRYLLKKAILQRWIQQLKKAPIFRDMPTKLDNK